MHIGIPTRYRIRCSVDRLFTRFSEILGNPMIRRSRGFHHHPISRSSATIYTKFLYVTYTKILNEKILVLKYILAKF